MIDPIALAQSLIRCPSVTPEEAGALGVLEAALAPLGFVCTRRSFGEGHERVENLFARWGKGGTHFCFAGHVDVVPVGDAAAWQYPPFAAEIHGGMLYGRGAEDMKAAIAAFIAAAAQFQQDAGKDFSGSISLLLTCDEEGPALNGTQKMLAWLKERDEIPDACLVGEPTNPSFIGEMAKIGRRGSMNTTLTVRGHQGHVAYPDLADNPVTRLLNILHALKAAPLDAGNDHFSPSNLEITSVDVGNPAHNVIPAEAHAKFNIRFNDLHSGDSLKKHVQRICEQHAPGQYTADMRVSGEPFYQPPGALSGLVVGAVEAAVGKTPALSTTGGNSDARFIHRYCPVIEFGATGKTPHMVNECVRVEDVRLLEEVYYAILQRFFGNF